MLHHGLPGENQRLKVLIIGFFKHPLATSRATSWCCATSRQHRARQEPGQCRGTVLHPGPTLCFDRQRVGQGSRHGLHEEFKKVGVKQVANEWLDERSQTDFRGQ